MKKNKITKLLLILTILAGCIILFANNTKAETTETGTATEASTTANANTTNTDTTGTSTDTTTSNLTDFSNAKFAWKNSGGIYALVISSVKLDSKTTYFYCITSSKDKVPNFAEAKVTGKDDEGNISITDDKDYITLNSDIYLWIYESVGSEKKLVLEGKKIDKPELKKNAEAFSDSSTLDFSDSNLGSWITFNYPIMGNKRKFNLKIGKVTDKSALKKVKENNDYTDVLDYAKKSTSLVYDNIEETTVNYQWKTNKKLFDASQVEDGAYYFVYVNFDNENGKYLDMEAVTIAKMKSIKDHWWLFLNGQSDFNWNGFEGTETAKTEEQPKDDTKAKSVIPQTGESAIAIATIIGVAGVGIFTVKKLNSMRDIK